MKEKNKSWVPAYLALGIIWGCSFIFIKFGLEFLTPVGVAFGRCALGALALTLISKFRKISFPREPKLWLHLWVVALLLNVLPGVLFAYAEIRVTSILAGMINAVTPLTTLLAMLILFRGEKVERYKIFGLAIGFLGVLTLLGSWHGFGQNPPLAVFALLGAVTCYGVSFPYIRKFILPAKLPPEALATAQVSLAALTLLPLYFVTGVARTSSRPVSILAMLTLGILGTGYAYILNFKIMAAAGSAIASTVTYLTPVVAVVVGLLFLGEKIKWYQELGGVIILIGAAVGQGRIRISRVEKLRV